MVDCNYILQSSRGNFNNVDDNDVVFLVVRKSKKRNIDTLGVRLLLSDITFRVVRTASDFRKVDVRR